MRDRILCLATCALLFAACNVTQNKNVDSITSGVLKIGIDDSYSLMMDSQIYTYTQLNKYATIVPTYRPEADVIQDLINDSIQAAVISRPLNDEELAYFKSKQLVPESIQIAEDAIAFIVNPENSDTTITLEKLKGIFTGSDSLWSQLNAASGLGKLQVVFDNNLSCNARTLQEKFAITGFPSWCFSQRSNEEVINYVSQNKNAIGVISLSWISDPEDKTSAKYRSMVKVMGIIDPANVLKPQMPRTPHQAYIFDKSYPLRRDVYYIRTGLRGTLGTGFANHLIGEKGQLIIHKMGMLASKTPNRIIKIKE